MKNKIKTFALLIAIILAYPNLNPALSWGDSISFGDFTSGMQSGMPLGFDAILDDLGMDKTELRYSVQSMNVARQKKNPPSVSVTFNPTNPVPGEKVSVVATPLYFLNDAKDMYFTWFLKSADCEHTSSPSASQEEKCDLNNDNRVNIEDYKIKAARIIASSNFEWENENYNTTSDSDGYKARYGGDDQGGKDDHCYIHDVKEGNEYEITCGHLFAEEDSDDSPMSTGDGTFGLSEEEFWRTDPNADDTAGLGNGDEANVAGLGVNTFSWNYEEGDEVGVAVEGVSIEPTQYEDSSYRTMWAATNNLCGGEDFSVHKNYPKTSERIISVTNGFDENIPPNPITTTITEETTESIESIAANIANITTTVVTTTTIVNSDTGVQISESSTTSSSESVEDISDDISVHFDASEISSATELNKCLYNSLISPAEGGGTADRLDISLSYFPKNPLNDPVSGSMNGDILTIHSALTDADDPKFVHYSWHVYQSNEINPDSWGSPILKSELPDSSQADGLNLNTFKFRLNFSHPEKYLKVKLNVTENIGKDIQRKGYADIIITIQSSSEKIKVYSADISENLNLSLNNIERCANESEENICPIVKNEIIGVRFPGSGFSDFAWTIDGAPFSYNNDPASGNTAFFPVDKNVGERITIGLSAANIGTGDRISLSKIFEVTEPKITIISADNETCGPNILGNYIDMDSKAWPDYSDTNFWAISGKQIKLKAQAVGFNADPQQYTWYVDGYSVSGSEPDAFGYILNSDGTFYLPSKPVGESYAVAVSALYAPNNLAKKALNKYWDVGYSQFYEKPVSDNINIVMKEGTETTAQVKNKKILAALYTSFPAYLAFLLRIVLTAFIILIGSTWLMSFFPNLRNEKN